MKYLVSTADQKYCPSYGKALRKKHLKGYKEDANTFQKIGNYLNRPEYKFQSKHTTSGILYWVKLRV